MRFTTDNCGRTIVDRGMGYVSVPAPGGLGNCFTGSCADGLAPYGWMSPPCGLPDNQQGAWAAAQMIASQGRPLQGVPQDGGLGNCFTGSCADGLAPYGWMSPPCGLTPEQGASWGAAQMIVSQGRPLQGPAPTPVPQAWNGQPVVNAKAGVFRPRAPRGFLKAA